MTRVRSNVSTPWLYDHLGEGSLWYESCSSSAVTGMYCRNARGYSTLPASTTSKAASKRLDSSATKKSESDSHYIPEHGRVETATRDGKTTERSHGRGNVDECTMY